MHKVGGRAGNVRLRQEARVLQRKAFSSVTRATSSFNSPVDEGRTTQVLLNLHHAFEMLLKASLVQTGVTVFDKKLGRSIKFDRCVNLAQSSAIIRISRDEAGLLRAVDALRNDQQHWFNEVSEQILYLHTRASITLFDEILQRVFDDRLANHLPLRILPVSTEPLKDLTLLIDDEYSQIHKLLRPGRRAGHEARARIRTLLAIEAHSEGDARVSSKDVERVAKAIRSGEPRVHVFPRLTDMETVVDGSGPTLRVHITKKAGPPVRYEPDETVPAAAVREVDLNRKFHLSPTGLAKSAGLSGPRSTALRRHLGLDDDDAVHHVFVMGSQRHHRYSDAALTRMKQAIEGSDMEQIWQGHRPSGRGAAKCACTIPGCAMTGY